MNLNNVHSSDKTSLSSLKSNFLLTDVWRKRNPRAISFIWSNSNNTQASRLDRFLVSKFLLAKVCLCNISPCVFSDHNFLDLALDLDGLSSCRSCIWKFNSLLLSDSDYEQMVTRLIDLQKLRIRDSNSLGDWWDSLKSLIRSKSIDSCIQKASQDQFSS